jgi:hypothetical protein
MRHPRESAAAEVRRLRREIRTLADVVASTLTSAS